MSRIWRGGLDDLIVGAGVVVVVDVSGTECTAHLVQVSVEYLRCRLIEDYT